MSASLVPCLDSARSAAVSRSTSSFLVALCLACGGGAGGGSGNTPPAATYDISGTVAGATVSGVTVSLSGAAMASTTTDASGNYSFTGLANGGYVVTPTRSGYTFAPASASVTVNGASATGQGFTAPIPTSRSPGPAWSSRRMGAGECTTRRRPPTTPPGAGVLVPSSR